MDQLSKVNQDNKHLKKVIKKKFQQNQANNPKSKTPTKDANKKTNKTGQFQVIQQRTDRDKTAQATNLVIFGSNRQEIDFDSHRENDHLDIDLLLTAQSDDE